MATARHRCFIVIFVPPLNALLSTHADGAAMMSLSLSMSLSLLSLMSVLSLSLLSLSLMSLLSLSMLSLLSLSLLSLSLLSPGRASSSAREARETSREGGWLKILEYFFKVFKPK